VTQYEIVPQARLREIAEWLAGWDWPLTEADSIARATAFGWTVVDEDPGKGELFGTGLLTARSFATSNIADGELFQITVFTSPVVDDSPDGQTYVTQVFAAQIETVSGVLGEPTSTESGDMGSATWNLTSGAVLRVGRTDRSCSWTVDSPDFAQLKSDVREYEDAEAEQQD
jgi:hypothetical protein